METPNQPQMSIDYSKGTECECEKCKNKTFKQSLMLYKISALVSPNGQEMYVPKPVMACDKCGHINQEFKDLKTMG